jgi:hypothetical protein
MPPPSEPAGFTVGEPAANTAVNDSATPIFGIVLGFVAMVVLALNALAY